MTGADRVCRALVPLKSPIPEDGELGAEDAADLLSISPRVMNYKIKTLAIEMPKRRMTIAS